MNYKTPSMNSLDITFNFCITSSFSTITQGYAKRVEKVYKSKIFLATAEKNKEVSATKPAIVCFLEQSQTT